MLEFDGLDAPVTYTPGTITVLLTWPILIAVSAIGGKPPLIERLERFTNVVAGSVLAAACMVAVLGVVLHNHSVHDMFLFSVALAVSAITTVIGSAKKSL